MIQAREVYNVRLNENNLYSNFTLFLFVWSGDKNTPPNTPTFSYSSGDLLDNESQEVNVSNLISDFIEQEKPNYNDGLNDFTGAKWFSYTVSYDNGSQIDESNVELFAYGFNNVEQNILLDGSELSMYDSFLIPFFTGGKMIIQSHPNNEINETVQTNISNISSERINVYKVNRPLTDKYITVTLGGQYLAIYLEDLNLYGTRNIIFTNSYGVPQLIPFYDKSIKSIEVEGEEYRGVDITSGHKFVDFNKNGRESLSIKSNYHSEQTNNAFRSLSLSETKWLYDGIVTPVNLDSKKVEFKTKLNDKLISYEFNLKYSFNTINTY